MWNTLEDRGNHQDPVVEAQSGGRHDPQLRAGPGGGERPAEVGPLETSLGKISNKSLFLLKCFSTELETIISTKIREFDQYIIITGGINLCRDSTQPLVAILPSRCSLLIVTCVLCTVASSWHGNICGQSLVLRTFNAILQHNSYLVILSCNSCNRYI